jgi:hypothetical protein
MGVTIVGPDGEEIPNRQGIVIPGYEMPEAGDDLTPGLEISIPDGQQEQQPLPPYLIPIKNPVAGRIYEILGDN